MRCIPRARADAGAALAADLRRRRIRVRICIACVAHGISRAANCPRGERRVQVTSPLCRCNDDGVRVLDAPRQHSATACRNGVSLWPRREARHNSLDRDRSPRDRVGDLRCEGWLMRAAVVGAGAWGTALADMLAVAGHDVCIWALEADVVTSINGKKANPVFLPEFKLAQSLRASVDHEETLDMADLVIYATPSQHLRTVARAGSAYIKKGATLAVASKGIEEK